MPRNFSKKVLSHTALAKIGELERRLIEAQTDASNAYSRAKIAEYERARWEARFDALLNWGKS